MNIRLLLYFIAMTVLMWCQERPAQEFTTSRTEHIINQVEEPIVVKSVSGFIRRAQGDQAALPNVLFEIKGPNAHGKLRRVTTNKNGYFRVRGLPAGRYAFKATLDGFQSVMGTIDVSNSAPKSAVIRLEMSVGV
jgi:hypothetical protein